MWENLKSTVNNVIRPNDNREITGEKHNNTLSAVINSLGKYSQFAGLAFKNTNPGAPDGPVFYFAAFKGVYLNFNRIEVEENEVAILNYNNNKWEKIVIGYSPIAPATIEDIRLTTLIDSINESNAFKTNFEFKQDSIADVQLPFLHAAVSHINADGQLIKGKPTSEVLIPVPLAEPSIDVDTPGKHGFMSYQDKDLLDSIPNYTISGKKISENPILTHDDIQGVAYLGEDGKIPSSLLPSYVDDVIEYDSIDNFPLIGEGGKIYLDKKTNIAYRWSGTTYVSISSSIALGETSSTAYAGDKGKKNAEDITDLKTNKADKTSVYTKEEVDYLLEHFKLPDHIKAITFSVDGILLSKNENGDLVIGGNVVVEGGISMYGPGQFGDSIMDYIIVDNESIKIIDGKLTVDPDFVGGGTVKGIKVNGYTYDEVDTNGYITIPDYPTELAWNSITGKPSTFTPSAHTHKIEDIIDIADASVSHATTADRLKKEIMIWGQPFDGSTDVEGAISNVDVINMANADTVISLYIKDNVLFIDGDLAVTGGITMYATDGVTSGLLDQVYAILDSSKFEIKNGVITIKGDIGDGKVKGATLGGVAVTLNANGILEFDAYPTTLPASDVYAWAKAATKPTYSWGEITEKPSSFTPSAHTHDDRYYTESEIDTKLTDGSVTKVGKVDVGSATKPIYLKAGVPTAVGTSLAVDITGNSATTSKLKTAVTLWGQSFDGSKAITGNLTNVGTITPTGEDLKVVGNLIVTGGIVMYADDGATIESGFAALLAAHIDGVTIKYNEAQQKIYSVMTGIKVNGATYKPSETDGYITIPDYPTSLDWENIENKPSTFTPASHTHTFASLTSKPTTLSGYGITDAKIANGVITLGTATITPLTAHQTVTLASGTNNGTLKLTVGSKTTDNIAVKGLGSAAYTASSAYAAASHTHSQYLVASSLDGYVNALTDNTSTNVFVTAIAKSGKTLSYTKSFTKKSLTAASHSGWSSADTDKLIIPDMSFIAYWNGAYNSNGSSNLAYCNKGAFGDMATASKSSYYTKTEVGTKLTDGSVTKLGTATVGSGTQHFYLNGGTATASTSTVGGTAKPMYLKAGVMTAISDTVGGTAKPIFLNSGTLTAISATVGSASKPVYLSGGSITACSYDFTSYLPLAGGTMGGTAWIVWPDSGNWGNNNSGVTFPVTRGGLHWVGQSDWVKLYSQETGSDNLNLVLQFGDDNSNGLSIRNSGGSQTAFISATGHITAANGTVNGTLKVGAIPVTNSSTGVLKIDGNLIVTGGITMYATDGVASGLMEQILVDGTTIGKKADGTLYAINTGNVRSIIMGSTTYTPNDSGAVTLPEKVTWANIEGKPSTFAPSSHTHAISQITNLQATLDGKAAASHTHSYLPLSGGTISGRLLVNYDGNSYTAPAIAINYYDSYAVDEYSIAQIIMGTPKYDANLGLSPAAKGYYGKVGYFMHIGTDYEFLWATSGWTKRMALECSSGNLWVSGSVTASSFVGALSGNASTSTKSEYSRSLLGRNTSGGDYAASSDNLVFAEWNTKSDNRWYLKASGYECRVAYASSATTATKLTSSAGSATLPIYFSDGKPVACTASSVFSNLSNSGNNISVTVAGQNRTLTVGYATTSSMLKTDYWNGGGYVSSDTHYMCLGYMNCTNSYDALTLLISSAFWGNQHGSQDIITIQQDTNTNGTKTVQPTVGRLRLGGSHERTFYYYKDNTNLRLYLYVYVTGGNSYGKWNISYLGGNATWVNATQTNVTKKDSWVTIGYSGQINYASSAGSAGNADKVDGYHATDGRTFNGNINWSGNWNDAWSDGTNKHPWYGFDHRYPNTGAYSTTITDYFGMTIKTAGTLRLDFNTLLLNGTSIYSINVASASKWQTARKITLTGSVTGSVYIDGSGDVTLATTTNHTHDGRYLRWSNGTADTSAMGWGTLTSANGYTILSHAASSDGGDMGFVYKNGQIFFQLDGLIYQNEGRYMCLDTGNYSYYALPLAGGTMTGALNFKNGTWNLMGDDAYIGDCNVAGMIGVKGANAATPGFALYNNSETLLGKLYASGGTLNWSGGTIAATTFSGNAATATKWATARTLTLTGSVTGSVSIDGSGNVSLATTTNHSHSQYLPLAGGTMTGTIKYGGANCEIIRTGGDDTSWRGGLKYSWSGNTTIALWGKNSSCQFVWHAGTDFSSNDVNGTATRTYDFQVGRANGILEALIGGNKIWHAGNDGSGSGLDADKLDGEHSSAFAHIGAHNNLIAAGNEFTFASSGFTGEVFINYRTAGGTNGNISKYTLFNGAGHSLGTIIHTGNYSSYALPLAGGTMTAGARISHADGNLYLGRSDNNGWVMCQDMCSQTALGDTYWSLRTDGTLHAKDTTISGRLTISSGADAKIVINNTDNDTYWSYIEFQQGGTAYGTLGTQGSKVLKWTGGDFLVSGGITMYSDLRKKNILSNEVLSVKEIAAAPLFRHTYKSDDNQYIHVGTSAQYWSGIHEDWFTRKDSEGYYQMELQNLGVAMGISLAREIVTFEGAFKKYESKTDKKIRLMKKKINDLEARIKELEGSREERRIA